MTPDELRAARTAAGMSPTQAAAALGISERTYYRWEQGDVSISQAKADSIRQRILPSSNGRRKKGGKA